MMETGSAGITLDNPKSNGYTKLAKFMGAHPELAIFKRFSYLNSLSLLHMQAELQVLEEKLQKQVQKDASDPNRYLYDLNWQDLRSSASGSDNESPRQWEILQEVTKLVRNYSMWMR